MERENDSYFTQSDLMNLTKWLIIVGIVVVCWAIGRYFFSLGNQNRQGHEEQDDYDHGNPY